MRFLLLSFPFLLFFITPLSAQQADSLVVLKILSAGDSGAWRNCPVKLEKDHTPIRNYYSDDNGIVKISAKGILDQYYNLTIKQEGQILVDLQLDGLPLNDTTIIFIPHVLYELEIVSYIMPVIEKERHWWQKKEIPVPFVKDTIYSADTLAKIERLKRGEWEWTDTSHAVIANHADFHRYLAKTIDYPEVAYKNLIEGIVVIEFMLDENEKIRTIKLIYGNDPSLALEVVKTFENMPALKFLQPEMTSITIYPEDNIIEGHSRPIEIRLVEAKPSVYRMSVKFKLR